MRGVWIGYSWMGSGWISIIRGYGHDGSIIRDRAQQQQQQQQFHVHLVLDELGDEELTVPNNNNNNSSFSTCTWFSMSSAMKN